MTRKEGDPNDQTLTQYIAIGPFCWGRGVTRDQAMDAMRKAGGLRKNGKFGFLVYKTHPDTHVDGMGALNYPADHPPVETERVNLKK